MARGRGGGARPRVGRLRHLPRRRAPRLAEKVEGAGELGGPPVVPEPGPSGEAQGPPEDTDPSATAEPVGCNDPDLQVVATCLALISAVAVLPDSRTALVAERTTGRVLRVQRGMDPVLLDDGAYIALDKPELVKLRALVEEARALNDDDGPPRISRFQSGLFEDLASLAAVVRQAKEWKRQVAGCGRCRPSTRSPCRAR